MPGAYTYVYIVFPYTLWFVFITYSFHVLMFVVKLVVLMFIKHQIPSKKMSYGFAVRLISSHCQSMAPSLLK